MKKWNPKAQFKPADKTQDEVCAEERWRAQAKTVIADVIARTEGKPDKVLLKELKDAYPFGSRAPARIWGAEVRRQRKLRKAYNDPRQVRLFDDP